MKMCRKRVYCEGQGMRCSNGVEKWVAEKAKIVNNGRSVG
jgi:hypothetical protein